jgi:chromosome segregation ATPase
MSGIDDISEDEQAYWELLAETNGLIKKLETDLAEQQSINEALEIVNGALREQLAEASHDTKHYRSESLNRASELNGLKAQLDEANSELEAAGRMAANLNNQLDEAKEDRQVFLDEGYCHRQSEEKAELAALTAQLDEANRDLTTAVWMRPDGELTTIPPTSEVKG